MEHRTVRQYSLCFKRQVIDDLESGRFGSIDAARRHYGIRGRGTIQIWLRKYGKNHLLPKVVIVQKPDEKDQIRELKRQVAELQRVLGQTQAQNVLNGEFLKLACDQLGCEIEAFKKKRRHHAVRQGVGQSELSVTSLCRAVGMTRQNYYKGRTRRKRQEVAESLILDLVGRERALQPKLGGRKLQHLIGPELESAGMPIGRDRFFELLSAHDLLVERTTRHCRTTDSWHGFGVYPNLRKDCVLTGPHQALVSDITYISTHEGFVYLALIMDARSRAIVGFDCSDSLESEGALRALGQAIGQLPQGCQAIHHSDRGIQYCCKAYVAKLKAAGLRISMTEQNHCYENSQAERLNGILKQEYGLGDTLVSKQVAYQAVAEAVALYNHRRPHQALGYEFPMTVHTAA